MECSRKKEFNANGSMKANARLAKEYTCALPHELTDAQRIHIVNDFCTQFIRKHNVIVDACIHAPHDHDDETNNKIITYTSCSRLEWSMNKVS